MTANVQPIPEGYHSLTPAITCKDSAKAIDFYKEAFGATEICRMLGPGGGVMHAGMSAAPKPGEIASHYIFLYTPDVDIVFNRAVAAGAQASMPVTDMFWGDRYGKVTDPFGHSWGVATHVEDVAPDEMARRSAEWAANMSKAAAASAGAN
jgi:PhnB protein